jgi:biotin carboxyl carrier protein
MPLEKIEAPLPGKITEVKVKLGDKISDGDEICIIEAMKMENPILSSASGIVKELPIAKDQVVKAGSVLAVIEY